MGDMLSRLGTPGKHKSRSLWVYSTTGGRAILNRGDDRPLKNIGQFASEQLARNACEKHFEKAKRALINLGKPLPDALFA